MLKKRMLAIGWLSSISNFYHKSIGFLTSLCGLFVLIKPDQIELFDTRPQLKKMIIYLQDNMVVVFVIVLIVGLITLLFSKAQTLKTWREIQFILDKYQEKCFSEHQERDLHRVTLFKLKRKRPNRDYFRQRKLTDYFKSEFEIFTDQLVPILRSGHTNGKTKTVFNVNSKVGNDGNAQYEGVAGRAYRTRNHIAVPGLPEIKKDMRKRLKSQLISDYANKTNCSNALVTKWIEDGKQIPRSIAATPVEVNGQIWGVLVLDSTAPEALSFDSISDYTVVIAVIGKLLERK